MTEKDELVQRAKLAEQAERWEAYIEQFEGIAPATMWLVLLLLPTCEIVINTEHVSKLLPCY